jgi:GT2 family glycosyltransferase
VAFVNGDALVTPTALSRLTGALVPGVALATASLRLYAEPDIMNSAGNPVHFTGLSWAGGLGRPSADYEVRRDVASASGAATVCRAEVFEQLGGFCDTMFAYCEDTDLSLRAWQRGWRVVYVPDAVVLHHYEFSRNPEKLYLLERNRMFMVLTVFGPALLAWALLPLVLLELATTAIALRDGWARQKFRAWLWLARNARLIAGRRRIVRAARVMPDGAFARILTGDLDPGVPGLAVPRLVQTGSRSYWNLARRFM